MSNTNNINKMLIDATHPEETRVVVLKNGRVEEFDFESAARKLLRGNIYLAKVTRVEPSLQAAFVDYGGNRHGFLAFSEIHPDYYQIPVADRQALIEEEAAQEAAEEAEVDAHAERLARRRQQNLRGGQSSASQDRSPFERNGDQDHVDSNPFDDGGHKGLDHPDNDPNEDHGVAATPVPSHVALDHDRDVVSDHDHDHDPDHTDHDDEFPRTIAAEVGDVVQIISEAPPPVTVGGFDPDGVHHDTHHHIDEPADQHEATHDQNGHTHTGSHDEGQLHPQRADHEIHHDDAPLADPIDETGAQDMVEEMPQRPRRRMRSYKIQEVIKRRQIILVQVVKEERGNKGAALTTYLSLAGRYTVLMPNTARGGGISRKITQPGDRKRLKAIANELEVPEGMGLIIRTAGAARSSQEIKRDFEYLLRLWESVRQLTLESTAPSLVYEEGNLIKRSIRDLYNKDVEEVVVAGDVAHREAQDFMRMLMPSHAKNVILHKGGEPLFTRYRMEQQLAAMFSPQVTLKSGGYIVINQTEALVAIDVNSGKSTREYSIEDTALNTNLEASDEIARQLKLRDLAGLIVIDFIDMEEKRNNRSVERRLKDALRFDRARIQLGRISHFGLMEMSRQRLRTGVLEGSTSQCPHCQGTGIIRSIESIALAVIRGLEDALMSGTRMALVATCTPTVALYILNAKRAYITDMEARHGLSITVQGSDKLQGANYTIDKVASATTEPVLRRRSTSAVNMESGFAGEDYDDTLDEPMSTDTGPIDEEFDGEDDQRDQPRGEPQRAGGSSAEDPRRRRRRGRRGGRRDERPEGSSNFAGGNEPAGPPRDEGYSEGYSEGRIIEVPSDDDEPEEIGAEGVASFDDRDALSSGDRQPSSRSDASHPGPGEGEIDGEGRARRGRRRGRRGGRRNGRDRERSPLTVNGEFGSQPSHADQPHASHDQAPEHVSLDATEHYERPNNDAPVRPLPVAHPQEIARTIAQDDPHTTGGAGSAVTSPAAPQQITAAKQAPIPASAPVIATVAMPEPKPRRISTGSSEPVLERVVVSPHTGTQNPATEPEAPKPVRRGWWQKTLGLE